MYRRTGPGFFRKVDLRTCPGLLSIDLKNLLGFKFQDEIVLVQFKRLPRWIESNFFFSGNFCVICYFYFLFFIFFWISRYQMEATPWKTTTATMCAAGFCYFLVCLPPLPLVLTGTAGFLIERLPKIHSTTLTPWIKSTDTRPLRFGVLLESLLSKRRLLEVLLDLFFRICSGLFNEDSFQVFWGGFDPGCLRRPVRKDHNVNNIHQSNWQKLAIRQTNKYLRTRRSLSLSRGKITYRE
jgi:hypothetical protein